jgi:hypothetical protein
LLALRAALALTFLAAVGAVATGSPAAAASRCPTETFLSFDHLAYVSKRVPSTVRLSPGSRLGSGTIDRPTSADGCRRAREPVQVRAAGSIEPPVAVMVGGQSGTIFVIGHRCAALVGPAYWDCLLRPLVFDGRRFTGTSYPAKPAPRRTVPLGAAIGTADLDGETVTVRRIEGVDPSLAVGVSGRPSEAFLSARTCPYEALSNTPTFDNLLRCLRSPVWFTFDPPGGEPGGTIVARSDRPPGPEVAGASISLVHLELVANLAPRSSAGLVGVGRVAAQVSFRVPAVPAGLYEAVVSCPRCVSRAGGRTLFPAGSILVTAKPKTSPVIRIVSYALTVAFVAAVIVTFRTWRRRRRLGSGSTPPGEAGS